MSHKIFQIPNALVTKTISFNLDMVPFTCHNLRYKKILNWIKTESSVLVKPSKPWGYPTIIQIEPTNRCNLSCPACPVSHGLDRDTGNMDFSHFRQLTIDLQPYLLAMLFWGWGEPFLHPQAYDMIKLATGKGIKVIASTNGHLFAEKKHAAEVVRSNLDVLVFSIDGLEQKTYEQFRKSGKLEVALEGVHNVLQERKKQNSLLPLVNLRFIVNTFNEHEIPLTKVFAEKLGVDIFTLRKFYSVSDYNDKAGDEHRFIPHEKRFQLPKRDRDNELIRVQNNLCKNLWNCPTIHWNGNVCSCFMDYAEQRPLGSLQKSSIKSIWCGEKYSNLRDKFKRDWLTTPICNRCGNGFSGGDTGREANAQAVYFDNQLE